MKTTRLKTIVLLAVGILTAGAGFTTGPQARTDEGASAVPADPWSLLASDITATVYNAVPEQCNEDCLHTASMYRIDPARIREQRILAMERTMMSEYGVRYGDTLRVEGVGRWDGLWQVQDTMNKRFAGQHKVDLLVPSGIRHGKWQNVKIYRKSNTKTLYPK